MSASSPLPFNFLRWFSALGFITVAAAAVGTAAILSHFLAAEMLQWNATVTAEFVVTVAETQSAYGGYPRKTGVAELLGGAATAEELGISDAVARASTEEFFDHLRALPGATFIRVYARDRSVAWSHTTDGHEEEPNYADHQTDQFLDKAFSFPYRGSLEAIGRWDYHLSESQPGKPGRYFVENYIPLYDSKNTVVAVVEIYKEPAALIESVRRGQFLVWASLVIAGLLIFMTLYWLARRASFVMEDQQRRLVDSNTLAAIGEMSLAVAHGIRTPLATIRSSAELILDEVPERPKKQVREIIAQADRLSHWLRELLLFSRPADTEVEQKVNLVAILRESIDNFAGEFAKAPIAVEWLASEVEFAPVVGTRPLFLQVFNSIIANAVDAMSTGGKLTVRCELEQAQGRVTVSIADTGAGMSEARLAQTFKPFKTSKVRGLGIGLTLVKSTLERHGGGVRIKSRENMGTQVELVFLLAR
jgi:two-component system sensor histidine kinase HydH